MILPQQDSPESGGFFEQVRQAFDSDMFMSWEFWIMVTVILVIGEILTAGFLLGAFVPGTLVAGLFAAFGWGFQAQLWGFVGGTLVGLFLLRPVFLRRLEVEGEPSNVDALVGLEGEVVGTITGQTTGRVRMRSEEWRASATEDIPAGTQVRVLGVVGNTLEVERIG
jgi:membrane protein implicated in regulation of membrane protease activity